MQGTKKIADAGKEAGKKVLAADTAQGVVSATVKDRAAKAGGRSPKRSTAKKATAKKAGAKKSGAKKSSARKSSAKKRS